ncbi:ABC transporter permease [Geodermatophilus sp. FMUSA9-8]|uniref:ABC transporter permease n=1 Tax=Geodermatophilus sp. FMUSA9-8 TaxID=3120155 RepID=UPI00300BAB4C
MIRMVARRLLALVPLVFLVTLVVWGLILIIPGDQALAIAGDSATPEQVEAIREDLGLDDPIPVRYGRWLAAAVQGDLGTSLYTSYSVTDALADRLPVTLSLVFVAFLLASVVGTAIGVLAANRRGRLADRVLTVTTSVGLAVPNFWLGLLLVTFFALKLEWFPSGGYVPFSEDPVGWLRSITLPAVTLATAVAAELARQMRASMSDVLERDFIRTHRAKGLRPGTIMRRYALKNAAMPVITVAGLQVARLFGLATVVEIIFNLNGVGSLAVDAVFDRDIPVIQGCVLLITVIVLLVNLVVDVSYGLVNPKVRTA